MHARASGPYSTTELTHSDAIVLTVANCGTRAAEYVLPEEPHDDSRPFTIEIRVS